MLLGRIPVITVGYFKCFIWIMMSNEFAFISSLLNVALTVLEIALSQFNYSYIITHIYFGITSIIIWTLRPDFWIGSFRLFCFIIFFWIFFRSNSLLITLISEKYFWMVNTEFEWTVRNIFLVCWGELHGRSCIQLFIVNIDCVTL